ncbi:MAG TPA: flagellar filament outer layer protein FlaA [Spirochaetia bacterium]|nr:flagellar filament outer layer protein FlaA [Spirochaetia bacterium]
MKRFLILIVVMFLALSASVMAEQSTLIDFAKLAADDTSTTPAQNKATEIDFSNQAGASFTEVDKAAMKSSLAIDNWDVTLASSSRTVARDSDSMTKAATVRQGASKFAGDVVMGIRVRFPTEPFNSYAIIKPPFEIPVYNVGNVNAFDGNGVVKNVGTLKSLSVDIMGLNFPERFGVILADSNNDTREIDLGALNFDGWRTLTWENPSYITDVRNRVLYKAPLYPNLTPYVRLVGFVVYRDAEQVGGDFISYIKDVNIVYDLATLNLQSDVDNEALWGILGKREAARQRAEVQRLGNIQVLRYLETQKMAKPADQSQGAQGGAAATPPAGSTTKP